MSRNYQQSDAFRRDEQADPIREGRRVQLDARARRAMAAANLDTLATCWECEGSGRHEPTDTTCEGCGGSGNMSGRTTEVPR